MDPRVVDFATAAVEDWRVVAPGIEADAYGLGLRLIRVGNAVRRLMERSLTTSGLSMGDWEVLSALTRNAPEALRPIDLAERFHITTAGITSRVDRLESLGLVVRVPHPNDRRATNLMITEDGIALAVRAFEHLASEMSRYLGDHVHGADADLLLQLAADLGDGITA